MSEKEKKLIEMSAQIKALRADVERLQQQKDYPDEGISALDKITWEQIKRLKPK